MPGTPDQFTLVTAEIMAEVEVVTDTCVTALDHIVSNESTAIANVCVEDAATHVEYMHEISGDTDYSSGGSDSGSSEVY
jgi:hypothetical protein